MNPDQNYDDRIINYLSNQMSDSEKRDFEAQIKADASLANDVEGYKLTLKGVEVWGDEQLRDIIHSNEQDLKTEGFFNESNKSIILQSTFRKPYNLNVWVKYAVAASLAILVVSMYFLFRTPASSETQTAFKQFYSVENQKIVEVISRLSPSGIAPSTSELSDSLSLGLKYYQQKDYEKSVQILSGFKAAPAVEGIRMFYLALSLIELKKVSEATSLLIPLADSNDFEMQEDAIWYLGLCYLSQKDGKSNAISLFKQLAQNEKSGYYSQAVAILNQLK